MNNDNQARELVREMRDALQRLDRELHIRLIADRENVQPLIARARAYLATPAGSTERPSAQSWKQAVAEIRLSELATFERIEKRARELDASRPPAKEADSDARRDTLAAVSDLPLDDIMAYVATQYPIAAIVRALDRAAPGFAGDYIKPSATTAPGEGSVSEEDVEAAIQIYCREWLSTVRPRERRDMRLVLESFANRRKGGSHE